MFENADLIFSYSRKQAIEDGVLVDLMQPQTEALVREAGFKVPVAMTAEAFATAVCPLDGKLPAGQDLNGRLWDVLVMLRMAISPQRNTDRVDFAVEVSDGRKHQRVDLYALIGPGDEGEPVLTIMLPCED